MDYQVEALVLETETSDLPSGSSTSTSRIPRRRLIKPALLLPHPSLNRVVSDLREDEGVLGAAGFLLC